MIKLREHPRLLGLVLVALVGLGGVVTVRVSASTDRVERMREVPPPSLRCGHAISEWLEKHGDHDFDEHD